MDTGDMVMLAVVAVGGYMLYQHVQQQQAAAATGTTTGAQTGSVLHMCPTGYAWVADASVAGGSCQPKGNTA